MAKMLGAIPYWAKASLVLSMVNWTACGIVYHALGGHAIGSRPSGELFYLADGSEHVPVSEGTWLFSLFYSAFSYLFFGVAALFCVTYVRRAVRSKERLSFAVLWTWLATIMLLVNLVGTLIGTIGTFHAWRGLLFH
jgi:hypothetical protein